MSIQKNLLRNGLASGLQKALRISEQFVLVPVFLSCWGTDYYGSWLTLTVIPTALSLSNLGMGTAASNTFVMRYAGEDSKGAVDAFKAGFVLLALIVGTLTGLATLGLWVFGDIINRVMSGESSIEEPSFVLAILLGSRLVTFFIQLFDALYRSARRTSLGIHAYTFFMLIKIAGYSWILMQDGRAIDVAWFDLVASTLFVLCYIAVGCRIAPKLAWRWSERISVGEFKPLFFKGLGYAASPAWESVYFQGMILVTRYTLGTDGVAIYSTMRTLFRSVPQIGAIVESSFFSEIQFEFGAGRLEMVRKLFRFTLVGSFFLAVLGVVALAVAGPNLYQVWTRGQLHPPVSLWLVMLIGTMLTCLWLNAAVVFRAANEPARFALMSLIGAILSVLASALLAPVYGLTGIALGSLAIDVLMVGWAIPAAMSILHQSKETMLRDLSVDVSDLVTIIKRRVQNTPGI